jgi:hypothetical protein
MCAVNSAKEARDPSECSTRFVAGRDCESALGSRLTRNY